MARQRSFSFIYSVAFLESLLVLQECTRKVTPWHAIAGIGGRQWYRSKPFATSELEGGVWSSPRPCSFILGKTRCPLYGSVGGTRGRSWRALKIRPNREPVTGPSSSFLSTMVCQQLHVQSAVRQIFGWKMWKNEDNEETSGRSLISVYTSKYTQENGHGNL